MEFLFPLSFYAFLCFVVFFYMVHLILFFSKFQFEDDCTDSFAKGFQSQINFTIVFLFCIGFFLSTLSYVDNISFTQFLFLGCFTGAVYIASEVVFILKAINFLKTDYPDSDSFEKTCKHMLRFCFINHVVSLLILSCSMRGLSMFIA